MLTYVEMVFAFTSNSKRFSCHSLCTLVCFIVDLIYYLFKKFRT